MNKYAALAQELEFFVKWERYYLAHGDGVYRAWVEDYSGKTIVHYEIIHDDASIVHMSEMILNHAINKVMEGEY